MNPSTEQLLQATNSLPVDQVILLPNNKNIHMAANQVAELTDKQVVVVPSNSIPQGLAALSAFNREAALERNRGAMASALEDVHAIEITEAVRDVELEGVKVVKGNLIGLVDGRLSTSGTSLDAIIRSTLS